jgi:hypothetical protein
MNTKAAGVVSVACAVLVPTFFLFFSGFLSKHAAGPLQLSLGLLTAGIVFLILVLPASVLGVPAAIALVKLRLIRWWSICAAAFASGFLSTVLMISFSTFDSHDPAASAWDDGTVLAQYGVPTHAGWLLLLHRGSFDGIFCVFTAMCGWVTWAALSRSSNRFAPIASPRPSVSQ